MLDAALINSWLPGRLAPCQPGILPVLPWTELANALRYLVAKHEAV